MYVVIDAEFDPERHTIWGPFKSQKDAAKWADRTNWGDLGYRIEETLLLYGQERINQRENTNV
jgi:hypothetical protein